MPHAAVIMQMNMKLVFSFHKWKVTYVPVDVYMISMIYETVGSFLAPLENANCYFHLWYYQMETIYFFGSLKSTLLLCPFHMNAERKRDCVVDNVKIFLEHWVISINITVSFLYTYMYIWCLFSPFLQMKISMLDCEEIN